MLLACSTSAQDTPQHSSAKSIACSEMSADACPPGLFCKEGRCVCGDYPKLLVQCNGTNAFAKYYHCATFDKSRNVTLIGGCSYLPNRTMSGGFIGDTIYYSLPKSVYELDHVVCSSLNRTGMLCGKCLPNHYSLAYSFNFTCIPCQNARWNWFR